MQSTLAERSCIPCTGATPRLSPEAIGSLLAELGGGWRVSGGLRLEKTCKFADFRSALAFTNRVGEVAEAEGHHPDIHLTWGRVDLGIWTHAVDGLTEADFILAAKINRLA
ncbi:MAG: 4a-hydroxytetrahydrobiopterin dehydratase [Nitrospirota bacterium]|nr:4a-hydroxytetrahydrobiopterin dehydratase [Nitrospirota bacterium]